MKKIISLLLLLIVFEATYGQSIQSTPQLTKQDYLQKSKNQKASGWLIFGGGLLVGAITTISNAGVDFAHKKKFPIVPVSIGAAMMVGSIPLFIASGKNKKRAMSITLINQRDIQSPLISLMHKPIPSLSISLTL